MELEDLKLISKLIHKYGIKAFEEIAEINSLFLSYMEKDRNSKRYSRFYENENTKIFTNLKSSIFMINSNIIDFNLLKMNTQNPIAFPSNDLQQYIVKAEALLGTNPTRALTICQTTSSGLILGGNDSNKYVTSHISLEDYKMISLLLKNKTIYVSRNEPIIKIESEVGKAYVFGKNSFKTIF